MTYCKGEGEGEGRGRGGGGVWIFVSTRAVPEKNKDGWKEYSDIPVPVQCIVLVFHTHTIQYMHACSVSPTFSYRGINFTSCCIHKLQIMISATLTSCQGYLLGVRMWSYCQS